ncbi:MAG: STAS domain-containing protein [Selenomonadaceae bacterium]|nr:STAS domain-containing protein [Selenomonadaceae bacterium]MBQ3726734.1 STAS domain-containing protein [Selenomonadaceae bacterium]MBQ9495966.1 STAS domain-containing protein [Selenomonadaceae bacterium]MBQ9497129.1 STAS domain-containing protein [Selenomonadaceae bacterium]MBR3499015.1 STAS domain-containing protein [Selenomonadaceae bacterium]
MEIKKEQNGSALTIKVIGRLDAGSAPELSKELTTALDGVTDLTFDFAQLQYIASAGLRVLLVAQKRMNKQGSMKLINVSEPVLEVLDMTGFASLMTIA